MSWIKDNKFMATLGGGTLVGVILLAVVGSQGSGNYTKAKEEFDTALQDASSFERGELYPTDANRDGKRKALDEYRKSVESLQTAFKPFQAEEFKKISPQEFADHLVAANGEVRAAFDAAGTLIPEAFFGGFERYKTSLASESATGILDYQLATVKYLLLELAKAKPTEFKNLYREPLLEEDGKAYTPAATDVARRYPMELVFIGTEKSARDFLSSVVKAENQFITVRTVRITNTKQDPPRASDAKFEKPAEASTSEAAGAFAGGFVLPGDEPEGEAPADATPGTEAAAVDTGKILAQVLGEEQVQVFVRLDLLQFLPEKPLP
jgi:hypothetical protein